MKSVISAALLAAALVAGASVVTQELVMVRSDGTLSAGHPALTNFVTNVVTKTYATKVTNMVNRVKDLHYDPTLQVTWTNVVNNGHIYYVTVTNTNISTL